MIPALAFTGSAIQYATGNGDLSSIVAIDSAQADVRFKNISDSLQKLWYRKTGTTGVGENVDLSPSESSGNISIDLTSARTIEYYIEGGGSVECYVVSYGGVLASTGSLTYSSTDTAHKLNHGDIYNNTYSGVTDAITLNAFRQVKSRIRVAGLTPPVSDDILAVAEDFYAKANMVWKGRMMGDLPTGANGSIISNDNINNSYKMFMQLGNEQVDNYIASVTAGSLPYDASGIVSVELTNTDFNFDQSVKRIKSFTEV